MHDIQGNTIVSDIISGYAGAQEFMSKYAACANPNKALILSELRAALEDGERDVVEVVGMTERLKSMILRLYRPEMLDEGFVRGVGQSLDRDALRKAAHALPRLTQAVKSGAITETLRAQGIGSVNMYLDKIEIELKGTDKESDIPALQREFSRAVVEKLCAIQALDTLSAGGRHPGLADEGMENILGEKLLERDLGRISVRADERVMDAMDRLSKDRAVSGAGFERILHANIRELSARKDDPQAIITTIELIKLYGGSRMPEQANEQRDLFDMPAVNALLRAA